MTVQTALHTNEQPGESARRIITWEWFAYIGLFVFALVLRMAALGSIPLQLSETHNALASFRAVIQTAPGDALTANSPILFLLQSISFSTLGSSEFAARALIAVLGALLVLSPLLFRDLLGMSTSFLLSALLALSPVLLIASRFSSPVVISATLAVVVLWCVWKLFSTRQASYGVGLIAAVGALVFLAEPGGPVTLAVIASAGGLAALWNRAAARGEFDFDETPGDLPTTSILRQIPWVTAISVTVLVVFLTATCFLIYPAGLSAVGEVLAGTVRGFVERAPESPAAYPLVTSLYYETFLWGLGIAGMIVLWGRGVLTLADRFFIAMLLTGSIAAALFMGGEPGHALWVTIPLAYLTVRLLQQLIRTDKGPYEWDIPAYARWLVAGVGIGLMAVFTIAFQGVARDLSFAVDGQISTIPIDSGNLILLLVSVLFALVSVFLAASLWSARTLLRGAGLAFLAFGAITSFGSGWRAAVSNAESPFELWHLQATDQDSALFSASLTQLAGRESRGFDLMPLTIIAPQDGTAAWLTRDFRNAEFVLDVAQAQGDPVVVIDSNIVPDLGGPYVGQDFTLLRTWPVSALALTDLPLWWSQARVGPAAEAYEGVWTTYLWLRQDVWQGLDTTAP